MIPKEAFDNQEELLRRLAAGNDVDFEDQYFERKEACRRGTNGCVSGSECRNLKEQVVECISAFANTNQLGGLIVLGASRSGELKGVGHLTETQRNSLCSYHQELRNHAAEIVLLDCLDCEGSANKLIVILVPYTPNAICETNEGRPRSWRRHGSQNELLDDRRREEIRRNKRIVDFELSFACSYSPADLDDALLREVRHTWNAAVGSTLSDEELLYQLGALSRRSDGYDFTNAGLLFFAANPQRVLASSSIRLLRYESSYADPDPGPPSLDKLFTGPVTKQIRDFRSVIRESALFKVYQMRRPDGGFVEEPEYPLIAVDEAVVNAVAHRDYAHGWPIECRYFRDAFVVRSPGTLIQRNTAVPPHFSLAEQSLIHTPRNPKLIEWLKEMRDQAGAAFVRALSEGTRSMRKAMEELGLPPPIYDVKESETVVTLLSEPDRRFAQSQLGEQVAPTEFTNLYPLQLRRPNSGAVEYTIFRDKRREFLLSLKDALTGKGWFIDRLSYGVLTAHRRGNYKRYSPEVDTCVRLLSAYSFAIREYNERSYLCLDFTLEVKNALKIVELLSHLQPSELIGRSAVGRTERWDRGQIVSLDSEWVQLRLYDYDQVVRVPPADVIPDLPVRLIKKVLAERRVSFDLSREIKQRSLSASSSAARVRAEWTQALVDDISRSVFPIPFSGFDVHLGNNALPLARDSRAQQALQVRTIAEPHVEFGFHKDTPDVRDGITRYGVYEQDSREIELVPVVEQKYRSHMVGLIDRLKAGKYKYRGSERTFRTRFSYANIITVPNAETAATECQRLLNEHHTWAGDPSLSRIMLVHAPEFGFSLDDVASPYYRTKRLLLEAGMPCQMVDTPTLENPDWKDLNLALNIVAKCGVVPWVLPQGIPDADFFVGLSYTQQGSSDKARLMGYANVFNEYGRWLFYSGNTQAFAYEERTRHLSALVKSTLERLKLSPTPNIYFHYTARFSRDDRDAILAAARQVRSAGVFTFVWINTHHIVRLYDSRPETDGSLSRGSYVLSSPTQLFLSTTGYNPYRKALGTPIMLEVNCWRYHPDGPTSAVDLKALATQILSLTKLNWSSTDSLCGEPITTKYAGDIAYLTAAFLRQGGAFRLHSVLERTPWFI